MSTNIQGFFLKENIKSGFLVFLIALPLSLGIAIASGFPPIAGIFSASIGGILVSLLGGSPLTIKGPAAGLIVIAVGSVMELGGGDMALGYKRTLAVGVAAAVIQILFALFRAASVGLAMSPSVVHGMLAAIGVIIISKQSHTMLGVHPEGKEPLELLMEIPHSLIHGNIEIVIIGLLSLLILFVMPLIKLKWIKAIPAPMVVLVLMIPLGLYFDLDHEHTYTLWAHTYKVGPEYLVSLPSNILKAVTFPDFSILFTFASLKYVIMFALVGTIESTLSVLAVDAMDPEKRASDLNKDLLFCGIGNVASAMIGGLPMISEIVRSKANIDAGAKSRWANLSHGIFLLSSVILIPTLLHEIPLSALAAMLVYTGARLASPKELMHVKQIGNDQLILFLTTMFVTLATDLLLGVAVGVLLKIGMHLMRGMSFKSLFKAEMDTVEKDQQLKITLHGSASFRSLLSLKKELAKVTPEILKVQIDLSDVTLVDHTFLSRLESFSQEWQKTTLEILGLEELKSVSKHPHATRLRK